MSANATTDVMDLTNSSLTAGLCFCTSDFEDENGDRIKDFISHSKYFPFNMFPIVYYYVSKF